MEAGDQMMQTSYKRIRVNKAEETDAICKVLAKYEQAEQENDEYM